MLRGRGDVQLGFDEVIIYKYILITLQLNINNGAVVQW